MFLTVVLRGIALWVMDSVDLLEDVDLNARALCFPSVLFGFLLQCSLFTG